MSVCMVCSDKPAVRANWVEAAMQGKMLETDKNTQAFRVWKPDASADEAFADMRAAECDGHRGSGNHSSSPAAVSKCRVGRCVSHVNRRTFTDQAAGFGSAGNTALAAVWSNAGLNHRAPNRIREQIRK